MDRAEIERIARRVARGQFPLRVPRQPTGEAPPTCGDDYAGQVRTFVSVSGYSDGLYFCAPGAVTWEQIGSAAPGGSIVVQEGDVTVEAAATTLDFDASDFNVTSSPAGEANIALAYGTSAGTPAEGNHAHANPGVVVQEGDSTVAAAATTLDFNSAHFDVSESPAGEANIALAAAPIFALTIASVDLGSIPRYSGEFTLATTGMTTGDAVLVVQIPGPYSGKGAQADEAEMGVIAITAIAESATVIRCYWTSRSLMKGNIRVAFAANAIAGQSFDNLSDVVLTAPADGNIVRFNGTNWVNQQPVGFLIGFLERDAMNDTAADFDWVNQPAAATEMRSTFKRKIDLTTARQVRFWVNVAVAGTAGADLYLRYSTDDASYTDITGATVTIDATGWRDSGWVDLPAGAKDVVWMQPWGKDGNSVADPRFLSVHAQIR